MKRLFGLIALLTVMGISRAEAFPIGAVRAGDQVGSDNWYARPELNAYYFGYGVNGPFISSNQGLFVWQTMLRSTAEGAFLSKTPQHYNQYIPSYLGCITDQLAVTTGACANDLILGHILAYGDLVYGATSKHANIADVSIGTKYFGAFCGGGYNVKTGVWPTKGCVLNGHPDVSVTPFAGIIAKDMSVEVDAFLGHDPGSPYAQYGHVDFTAALFSMTYAYGKNYTPKVTWFMGSFFRVAGVSLDSDHRGAVAVAATVAQDGSPCPQIMGTMLVGDHAGNRRAWFQNELVDVFPEIKNMMLSSDGLAIAGGTCYAANPQPHGTQGALTYSTSVEVSTNGSPALVLPGLNYSEATLMNIAQANKRISDFLMAPSSGKAKWADVIISYAPKHIYAVGYADDGDHANPYIQVGYYCDPDASCDTTETVRNKILGLRDKANPAGGTIRGQLVRRGIRDLRVEMSDERPTYDPSQHDSED